MKFRIKHRSLRLAIAAFAMFFLSLYMIASSDGAAGGFFAAGMFMLCLSIVMFILFVIPATVTVSEDTVRISSFPAFRKINVSDIKGLSLKQTYVKRYVKYRGSYEESRLILEIDVNGKMITLNGEASSERPSFLNMLAYGEGPEDDPQISRLYEHLKYLTGLEGKNGV